MKFAKFSILLFIGINGSAVYACYSKTMVDMQCKENGELCCYRSTSSTTGRHTNFGKIELNFKILEFEFF